MMRKKEEISSNKDSLKMEACWRIDGQKNQGAYPWTTKVSLSLVIWHLSVSNNTQSLRITHPFVLTSAK